MHDARARLLGLVAGALALVATASGGALAHGASLSGEARELAVPTWLFLLTGGAVVGASFLLTSFLTDRAFVRAIHDWRAALGSARPLRWAGRVVGHLGLLVIVAAGFLGPTTPLANAAVLLVWVGWWAALAILAYLVGNAWPALDPARTLASALPTGALDYPERLGAWPGAFALLALVWLEVVSPISEEPRVLAFAVTGYVALTLAGAVAFGAEGWFENVDPVSRVFRFYGLVAPLQRVDGRLTLTLPGSALVDADLDAADVAFVVALLWGTTYDGFVATPAWATIAEAVVGAGVPPNVLYPVVLLVGYLLFVGVYLASVRGARSTAPTFYTTRALAARFGAALLPIAAGYHLAHYLTYCLSLAPALAGALTNPMAPPPPRVLVLPAWVSVVAPVAVLAGHVLAVWVAHAVAYDTLPGRLQAARSQYALTLSMVFYTITSLWVVSQPSATPPYL